MEELIFETKMKSVKVYSIIMGNCKFSIFGHTKDYCFVSF